jgi:hypothetical protein
VADLAHSYGCIEIMAYDVADTDHQTTVGKHHGVVPITADFDRPGGRAITGRKLESFYVG